MASPNPNGASDGSGSNRSSKMWIAVMGCVILVALVAAMLMHSGGVTNRPSLPGGTQTQQR